MGETMASDKFYYHIHKCIHTIDLFVSDNTNYSTYNCLETTGS